MHDDPDRGGREVGGGSGLKNSMHTRRFMMYKTNIIKVNKIKGKKERKLPQGSEKSAALITGVIL